MFNASLYQFISTSLPSVRVTPSSQGLSLAATLIFDPHDRPLHVLLYSSFPQAFMLSLQPHPPPHLSFLFFCGKNLKRSSLFGPIFSLSIDTLFLLDQTGGFSRLCCVSASLDPSFLFFINFSTFLEFSGPFPHVPDLLLFIDLSLLKIPAFSPSSDTFPYFPKAFIYGSPLFLFSLSFFLFFLLLFVSKSVFLSLRFFQVPP